jgi:hypothetical protein
MHWMMGGQLLLPVVQHLKSQAQEGSASIVDNVQRARCSVAAFSMFLQACNLSLLAAKAGE